MLDVVKCLSNKDFFLWLKTIPLAEDALTNDAECHLNHLKCWVAVQREVQNESAFLFLLIFTKINLIVANP